MVFDRRPTPLYFQKADIIRLFGISGSEYNDLIRERPTPRVAKKKISTPFSDFSAAHDKTPFFSPIAGPSRGTGYNLILSVPDLMVLNILITFRKNGLDRSLGRAIRKLIENAKSNRRISQDEQVWTEWFRGPTNDEMKKWKLEWRMSQDGWQDLVLKRGLEKFEVINLMMDPDLGLIEIPPNTEKAPRMAVMMLTIDLEQINQMTKGAIDSPFSNPKFKSKRTKSI